MLEMALVQVCNNKLYLNITNDLDANKLSNLFFPKTLYGIIIGSSMCDDDISKQCYDMIESLRLVM